MLALVTEAGARSAFYQGIAVSVTLTALILLLSPLLSLPAPDGRIAVVLKWQARCVVLSLVAQRQPDVTPLFRGATSLPGFLLHCWCAGLRLELRAIGKLGSRGPQVSECHGPMWFHIRLLSVNSVK